MKVNLLNKLFDKVVQVLQQATCNRCNKQFEKAFYITMAICIEMCQGNMKSDVTSDVTSNRTRDVIL